MKTRERICEALERDSATRRYLYATCGPRDEVHDELHDLAELGVIEIDHIDSRDVLSLHPGARVK